MIVEELKRTAAFPKDAEKWIDDLKFDMVPVKKYYLYRRHKDGYGGGTKVECGSFDTKTQAFEELANILKCGCSINKEQAFYSDGRIDPAYWCRILGGSEFTIEEKEVIKISVRTLKTVDMEKVENDKRRSGED